MKINADISKRVGWEGRKMKYPSLKQVQDAIEGKDEYNLLRWYRFLDSPENERQSEVLEIIVKHINT